VYDAKPVQAGCDSSSTAQEWKVLDVEGDAVKLRNAASSQCLGVGDNPAKGAAVTQRPCAIGDQKQMWLLRVYRRSGFVTAVCKTDTTLQLGLSSTAKNSAVVLVDGASGAAGRFVLGSALK
jgi:hypothetical protein